MKKFKDESGWLRVAVCSVVLLTQYAIRDTMLTAFPVIASGNGTNNIFFPEADLNSRDDPTLVSNEYYTLVHGQENPEFKSDLILDKANKRSSLKKDNESKSPEVFGFDSLIEEKFRKMSRGNSDSRLDFHSQPLFWTKLGGRNARLALGNPHEKLFPRSISRQGKHIPFFPSESDVREREDVFRKIWDYIRTGNEREREDKRDFIKAGEFHIPAGIDGQNSSTVEWTIMNKGIVLSSVYWGWLITALLADIVIKKLGANLVMTLSVSVGSLTGILMHASSIGGPWVLLPFRVVFGAAQGLCYPAVMSLLQGIPESSRIAAGAMVFIGPPLGSCMGVGLGSLDSWYISTYLFGSLAIPLIPLCLMVPATNDKTEKKIPAMQIIRSVGVWACSIVYAANIFTFHTVLVGVPICLTYITLEMPSVTGVVLLSILLVVFIVVGVTVLFTAVPVVKVPLTVLNRRRLPVAVGNILIVVGLIVMATAGLEDFNVLVGIAIGLVGPGIGLTRISCRLNMEDLAPWSLHQLLNIINIVGVFIAIWPPIMVAGLADANDGEWVAIWLIPLVLIVPSAAAYMFLLTANPQAWDDRPDCKAPNIPNGAGPSRDIPAARGHAVRMSFKSARSGFSFKSALSSQTFKTAVSRMRSRTFSARTVDEDLSVDMHSVIDEDQAAEVYSIEGSNQDCRSVVSTVSFKSDGADMHSIDLKNAEEDSDQRQPKAEMFTGSSVDRTSAWLSYHHHVTIENEPPACPTKMEMRRRNAIYDLFW